LRKSRRQRWFGLTIVVLWTTLVLPSARAQSSSSRQQAQLLEKQGRWFEACSLYDELLSKDRNNPELREAYRRCLRHFRQVRRLTDEPLQAILTKLTLTESADLYEEILNRVTSSYVERERVDLSTLFHQGLQELRFALDEKSFIQKHLARAGQSGLETFKARLSRWEDEKVRDLARAKSLLREVMQTAWQIRIAPGVIALECACGASNSLDEYSLYLAPSRYSQAETARKNKYVGIGIELAVVNQKYEVARVYRKSPAAMAGLLKGDRVVRIDGQALDPLAPDVVLERLRGEPGTFIELEILPRRQMMPQTTKIERQDVLALSVDFELRRETGSYFAYLHIHNFQESTLQEVKTSLEEMQKMMPVQGVILDLRGNPGGLFESAVAVAKLFLPEGVVVHRLGQLRKSNQTYRSQSEGPYSMPVVVLVDGETASAAEVLAGALKDNQRAKLFGQPTFGKASIQGVVPLERGPGGLRLTVAKFHFSSQLSISGRGIIPDQTIEEGEGDPVLKEAEAELLRLLMSMRMVN